MSASKATITKTSQKNASLLRSTGVVASMTFISRVLGFIRDMIIAHTFGAIAGTDAFFVAFKIPNFMRRLFAEGGFAQAFVPTLANYQEQHTPAELRRFLNAIAGCLGLVLLITTIVAIVIAPLLIHIFAPGFNRDPIRFELAAYMLRITFPYLLLISLTAFAGAILNTLGFFAIPALTPTLLNISFIVATLACAEYFSPPVTVLAWAVLIAGFVQLGFNLIFLLRQHIVPIPRPNWQDQGVKQVLRRMVPTLFGASVAQVNLMLDTLFASFLPAGSVSWLYFSDRLNTFPLGVFGVAIATVILPHLSRQDAKQNNEAYSKTIDWALRNILLLALPSAIGLICLAGPILATLFNYGEFKSFDVRMTQLSLMAFASGLPAFMAIKVLTSGFYARGDVKTPVKIGFVAMLSNAILNLILIHWLAHVGLALATSLAGYINAGLLWYKLKQQNIYQAHGRWLRFTLQSASANLVLTVFLVVLTPSMTHWLNWLWWQRISYLCLLLIGAIVIYGVMLGLCRVRWRDVKHP
ncbi:MAG: murein biosynthesis integral membrane protein MurJ [Gammaproteobacteria bacterium]